MKITDARALIVRSEARPWLFIEVETDSGLLGIGEASQSRGDRGVAEQVEALKARIVGRDPLELANRLAAELYRDPFAARIRYAAVSGLEQALWDLAGKALGVPCYVLFGGAVRDSVRLYANIGLTTPSLDPDDLARTARRAVDEGFSAVKMYPLGNDHHRDPARVLERSAFDLAIARLAAVREAIGPKVDLMTDWAWNLSPADARRIARAVEPFNLYWIEEPFSHTDPAELARFRAISPTRLAGGEQRYGRRAFQTLIDAGALDIVMPDVKWDGGIGETRAICAAADARDVEVSLHNMSGPVATAASLHIALATPNCAVLEYCWGNTPWRAELVNGTERVSGGRIARPSAPGLGIEWNREAARRLQTVTN